MTVEFWKDYISSAKLDKTVIVVELKIYTEIKLPVEILVLHMMLMKVGWNASAFSRINYSYFIILVKQWASSTNT